MSKAEQHYAQIDKEAFNIGQGVLAKNFQSGTKWIPGTIIQKIGPLIYLVKVKNDVTWKQRVDQLRSRSDQSNESSLEESELETTVAYPNTAPDPDVTPIPDNRSTGNNNSVSLSVSPSSSSTQYPRRENHRPPDRLG